MYIVALGVLVAVHWSNGIACRKQLKMRHRMNMMLKSTTNMHSRI